MNSGNMVVAMNSTVIKGTERKISMNEVQRTRITGSSDRRPRARTIPMGSAEAMPIPDMTRVSNTPPHLVQETCSKDNPVCRMKPTTRAPARMASSVLRWLASDACSLPSKRMRYCGRLRPLDMPMIACRVWPTRATIARVSMICMKMPLSPPAKK